MQIVTNTTPFQTNKFTNPYDEIIAKQTKPDNDIQRNETHIQDSVVISKEALSHSRRDDLYKEIDDIFKTSLNENEFSKMQELYKTIDKEFANELHGAKENNKIDSLLGDLDAILEKAESKMSGSQMSLLNSLQAELDTLTQKEDAKTLNQEHDELLYSTLDAKEKKEIDGLNNSIKEIFNGSELSVEKRDEVEKLFSSLDDILNTSYSRLSQEDQQTIDTLDREIDSLNL
ncbi:MAG: hypothetical protein GQ570_04555 [Helicobacteraceae bacterium]|nr:hypothetical protein [Helicobacteraceae bacterium]